MKRGDVLETLAFGRSSEQYKKSWSEGKEAGGLKGGISSVAGLFRSSTDSSGNYQERIGAKGRIYVKKEDIEAFRQYNTELNTATDKTAVFEKAQNSSNKALAAAATRAQGASIDLKNYTVQTKLAGVAMNTLNTIGNMVFGAVIGLGISFVINKLTELANESERLKEAVENFHKSFDTLNKEQNENTKTISDLEDKYKELSKGVSATGENISLTTQQYSEYKDIINKISEIMPDLTVHYNEQGEAIGFVSGQLKDLTQAYREQQKEEARSFLYDKDKDGNVPVEDVIDNFLHEFRNINSMSGYVDEQYSFYGVREKLKKIKEMNQTALIQELTKARGTDRGIYDQILQDISVSQNDLEDMSKEEFSEIQNKIVAVYEGYNQRIETAIKTGRDSLIAFFKKSEDSDSLSNEQYSFFANLFSGLSEDDIIRLFKSGVRTPDEIQAQVNNMIIDFKTKSDDVMTMYNDLSKTELGKGKTNDIDKYINSVQDYSSKLSEVLGVSQESVLKITGKEGFTDLKSKYETVKKSLEDANKFKSSATDIFKKLKIKDEDQLNILSSIISDSQSEDELLMKYRYNIGKSSNSVSDIVSSVKEYNKKIKSLSKYRYKSKRANTSGDPERDVISHDLLYEADDTSKWKSEQKKYEKKQKEINKVTSEQISDDTKRWKKIQKEWEKEQKEYKAYKPSKTLNDPVNDPIAHDLQYVADDTTRWEKIQKEYEKKQKKIEDANKAQKEAENKEEEYARIKQERDEILKHLHDTVFDKNGIILSDYQTSTLLSNETSVESTNKAIANVQKLDEVRQKYVAGVLTDAEKLEAIQAFPELQDSAVSFEQALENISLSNITAETEGINDTINDLTNTIKIAKETGSGFSDSEIKDLENQKAAWEDYRRTILATNDARYAIDPHYTGWQRAQQTADEGNMYDTIQGGLEDFKKAIKSGQVGTDQAEEFAKLFSKEGTKTSKLNFSKALEKAKRYLGENNKGMSNFIDDMVKNKWMTRNGGNVTYKGGDLSKIADDLGISVDAVKASLKKLNDYKDWDIKVFDTPEEALKAYNETLVKIEAIERKGKNQTDKDKKKLEELVKSKDDLKRIYDSLNKDRDEKITDEINKAKDDANEALDLYNSVDKNKDLSEAAKKTLKDQYKKQYEDWVKTYNLEADGFILDIEAAAKKRNKELENVERKNAPGKKRRKKRRYKTAKKRPGVSNFDYGKPENKNTVEHHGMSDFDYGNPENKKTGKKAEEASKDLEDSTHKTAANVDDINNSLQQTPTYLDLFKQKTDSVKDSFSAIGGILDSTFAKTYDLDVKTPEFEMVVDGKTIKVKQKKRSKPSGMGDDPRFGPRKTDVNGTVAGLGFAHGTFGHAYAKGLAGRSLIGELGPELLVRDNKWHLMGENGAEAFDYHKDDIIFNHEQTADLMKTGAIRGRGEAFLEGTAFKDSTSSDGQEAVPYSDDKKKKKKKSSKKSRSKKSSKDKSKSTKDKQEIDWLERRLERIQTLLDQTAARIENIGKVWIKVGKGTKATFKSAVGYIEKAGAKASKLVFGRKTSEKDDIQRVEKTNANLDAQNKLNRRLFNEQSEAQREYAKKAKKSRKYTVGSGKKKKTKKIPSSVIKKIKSGKYSDKDLKYWFKKYGQSAYDAIQNYIDYYDKSEGAKKSKQEIAQQILQNKIQKHQNKADLAQSYATMWETKQGTMGVSNKTYGNQIKAIDKQSEYYKKYYAQMKEIAKLDGDNAEYQRLEAEETTKLRELADQKIDVIIQDYDNSRKKNDHYIQDAQNMMNVAEAQGKHIQTSWYKSMNINAKEQIKSAKEERDVLINQIKENLKNGEYDTNSKEYQDDMDKVQEVENYIAEKTADVANNMRSIREIVDGIHDEIRENNTRMADDASFYANLMSQKPLIDDETASWTREGFGTLGSYGIALEVGRNNATETQKQYEDVKAVYDKVKVLDKSVQDSELAKLTSGEGKQWSSFEELKKDMNTFYDSWKENINETKEAQDNMISMMNDYYNAQIEHLNKIIDAKKKILDEEKDLYDYEKTINEKTKNIATLQKRMAALKGDQSEEGQARLNQIRIDLDEAQKDLQDTEYERWKSDQENMLDNLATQYDDIINKHLKYTDTLIEEAKKAIVDKGQEIKSVFEEYTTNVDYEIPFREDFSSIVTAVGETNGDIDSIFGDNGSLTAVLNSNNAILAELLKEQARSNGKDVPDSANDGYGQTKPQTSKPKSNTVTPKEQALSGFTGTNRNENQIWNWMRKHGSITKKKSSSLTALNKALNERYGRVLTKKSAAQFADYLGIKWDKKWTKDSSIYKYLKKHVKNGFKTGGIGKLVKANGEDGLAMVRNGEGFVAPEHVEAIQKLLKIVPDMSDNLSAVPATRVENSGNTNVENFTIELPNVTDPDSFVREFQNNKKVQRIFKIGVEDIVKKGSLSNQIYKV